MCKYDSVKTPRAFEIDYVGESPYETRPSALLSPPFLIQKMLLINEVS